MNKKTVTIISVVTAVTILITAIVYLFSIESRMGHIIKNNVVNSHLFTNDKITNKKSDAEWTVGAAMSVEYAFSKDDIKKLTASDPFIKCQKNKEGCSGWQKLEDGFLTASFKQDRPIEQYRLYIDPKTNHVEVSVFIE